mmetsp:Transcript_41152/g.47448  ORF Transcript_41152/g.47448 Transcript_41152/m.47448 type:complete len:219 (+) Transcript_41152:49-705(+)
MKWPWLIFSVILSVAVIANGGHVQSRLLKHKLASRTWNIDNAFAGEAGNAKLQLQSACLTGFGHVQVNADFGGQCVGFDLINKGETTYRIMEAGPERCQCTGRTERSEKNLLKSVKLSDAIKVVKDYAKYNKEYHVKNNNCVDFAKELWTQFVDDSSPVSASKLHWKVYKAEGAATQMAYYGGIGGILTSAGGPEASAIGVSAGNAAGAIQLSSQSSK